jgi:hypothetical protein
MRILLELTPELTVKVNAISAVKRGATDSQAVIFLKGQSALEGFVVEREYEDVCEEWRNALEEEDNG